MKGVTKEDLKAPLLDLPLPWSQEAQQETDPEVKPDQNDEGKDGESVAVSPTVEPYSSADSVSPTIERSPEGSPSWDPGLHEQNSFDFLSSSRSRGSRAKSQHGSRPVSQQSQRTVVSKYSTAAANRAKANSASIKQNLHRGLPAHYSAGLTDAYLGAASNDEVRKLLEKANNPKGRQRPVTAC